MFSSRAILIVKLGFLTGLYKLCVLALAWIWLLNIRKSVLNSAQFVYLTSISYLHPTIPINDHKCKCFHDLWLRKQVLVCLWNDYYLLFCSVFIFVDLLYFFTDICLVVLIVFMFTSDTKCYYFMLFPSCCIVITQVPRL